MASIGIYKLRSSRVFNLLWIQLTQNPLPVWPVIAALWYIFASEIKARVIKASFGWIYLCSLHWYTQNTCLGFVIHVIECSISCYVIIGDIILFLYLACLLPCLWTSLDAVNSHCWVFSGRELIKIWVFVRCCQFSEGKNMLKENVPFNCQMLTFLYTQHCCYYCDLS